MKSGYQRSNAPPVYLVRLKSGVVVQMTRVKYEALWKGCDPLACKVLAAPEGWEWKFEKRVLNFSRRGLY